MQHSIMHAPRTVDVDITARCNLRCRYCYFFNNPTVQYRDLPTGEWLEFFTELGRLGVMTVCLAGGEPFIRPDLQTLLMAVCTNRMRFSILSNGALIDDAMAGFLAKCGRCDFVQVSIDGSSAEVHDACRGKGSFEGAVRGIRTLQRNRAPVTARVTVHRHNVHHLEAIAKFLLEEMELEGFSTNSAGYLGSCRIHPDSVMLCLPDRALAMETLQRLSEKYPGRITASAGPLADADMWSEMEQARRCNAPPFADGGRLTGCGCPSSNIAVRSDGVITPCTMLPHMELGRINCDSLLDVWRNNADLNALRNRHHKSLAEFSYCAECEYMSYCTGNCPGLAYTLTGSVDHPSPDACYRTFIHRFHRFNRFIKPESVKSGQSADRINVLT